jgi:DNA-binding NarL/FixJ family response regulator
MTTPDPTQADHYYHQAQNHPHAHHFPYELARIHLAHGTRQRHTHGPKTARHSLTLAAQTFQRLGATPWAERAHAELRVSGLATRTTVQVAELTWQERRIADLAASGLTNKEIGERMHLSPRTVSSHLYRVFPKLGITSRAALRDALGKMPDDQSV